MNNYIYILCNSRDVKIDKLHFCTWNLENQNASIELGLSIPVTDNMPDSFDVYVFAPFLNENCEIHSLHNQLNDAENFKFIFNEKHLSSENIGEDGRSGHIIKYNLAGEEKKMAIVKPEHSIEQNNCLKLTLTKHQGDYNNLYCRLYVKTQHKTLAEQTKGISKNTYKFDFKLNEERNIPSEITDFRIQNNLFVMKVEDAYCLHCVPSDYELSYSDARKLKNLRILENDAFNKYFGDFNNIKGEYIIAFQKDKISGSGSFYTSFSQERIGNKQLALAIGANLICSFLFAFYSLRVQPKNDILSLSKFPYEFILALVLIAFCCYYCFRCSRKKDENKDNTPSDR